MIVSVVEIKDKKMIVALKTEVEPSGGLMGFRITAAAAPKG
jgi:hypothetical protein